MEKQPLVSVIIPCWNCSKDLRAMLDSIIVQTYRNWVAYCIDDRSTDNTAQVIKEYSNKDSRIVYFERNREPKGAQTCRNIGFELSSMAKYVIWFDSDDIIAPYCLEQRVCFMEDNPDIDFGVFKAKSFYESIDEMDCQALFGFPHDNHDDLKRFLSRNLPFVVWNNIYKRKSLVGANMSWDESILSLQDSDFNIQSLLHGLKYKYASESKIDYYWRLHHESKSISQKINSKPHQKSHIYYYTKLNASLSSTQRKHFKTELDNYLLFFICKFHGDKMFSKQMLRNNRFDKRPFFRLKVAIFNVLPLKFKAVLFPLLSLDDYCVRRQKKACLIGLRQQLNNC